MSGLIFPCPGAPSAVGATSGFGSMPVGVGPFGTSMPPIASLAIEDVFAIRENVVRVTFNVSPKFTQLGDPNDAAAPARYNTQPVPGTTGRDGEPTKPVTVVAVELVEDANGIPFGNILDLILDRPMSPEGALYTVTITGLVNEADILLPSETIQFVALFKQLIPLTPEFAINNRDIANPQTQSALLDPLPLVDGVDNNDKLGTYQVDSQGDVAHDEGLTSYKKRIFRRLLTQRGRFSHLPNYGVSIQNSIKQLGLPAVRENLASEAEEQIALEPETVAVSVTIVPDETSPGLYMYRIRARPSFGPQPDIDLPISFSPTGT